MSKESKLKEQIAHALYTLMPDPSKAISKVIVFFSIRKEGKKSLDFTIYQQVNHKDFDNYFRYDWNPSDGQFKSFREATAALLGNPKVYYAKASYMQGSIAVREYTLKGVWDKKNVKQSKVFTFSR